MSNSKKRIFNSSRFMIIIIMLIVVVIGGTFAWLSFSSRKSALVLSIGDINDSKVIIKPYQIRETMTPVNTYTSGVYSQITAINNNSENFSLVLYYKINELNETLINNGLKYTIVSSNSVNGEYTEVKTGDFKDSSGNKIEILKTDITFETTEYYRVYLWLDSSVGNQVEVENSTIDIELNGSGNVVGANPPVLDDGMIPVTISNTGVVTTISEDDEAWYDYSNKEWANVVLVKENSTTGVTDSKSREYYKNNPGTTVVESDILAYYVWIPRYSYRIRDNVKCSELEHPSVNGNPECYLPLVISDESDKASLIEWLHSDAMGYNDYTIEEATEDVETMLNNGSVYIEEDDNNYSIVGIVSWYNDENDSDITYSGTFKENNIVTGAKPIDILFEPKIAQVNNGNAVDTYKTHPAFIWDGQTISGMWVGKFESTGDETTPTIKPNLKSLRSQNVSTQFQTSLKFAGGTLTDGNVTFSGSDIYGLTINSDSHMMKNSEWGAVAYLSHSQYGTNQEIYINDSKSFYTGRSGGNIGGKTEDPLYGTYSWIGQVMNSDGTYGTITDSTLGTKASTTGNITGVYDMSGGALEYVMGVLSDTNGNPRSGKNINYHSGFNGLFSNSGNEISYTSGISFPNSKYYDLYLQSQFYGDYSINEQLCTLETCGGHALNETKNWYSDGFNFVSTDSIWFSRGDHSSRYYDWSVFNGYQVGVFYTHTTNGDMASNHSWRSVIITLCAS